MYLYNTKFSLKFVVFWYWLAGLWMTCRYIVTGKIITSTFPPSPQLELSCCFPLLCMTLSGRSRHPLSGVGCPPWHYFPHLLHLRRRWEEELSSYSKLQWYFIRDRAPSLMWIVYSVYTHTFLCIVAMTSTSSGICARVHVCKCTSLTTQWYIECLTCTYLIWHPRMNSSSKYWLCICGKQNITQASSSMGCRLCVTTLPPVPPNACDNHSLLNSAKVMYYGHKHKFV